MAKIKPTTAQVIPNDGSDPYEIEAFNPFAEVNADADIDEAFEQLRNAFQKAETPGVVRISKLPTDEQGNPLPRAQGSVHLASYPIDQYNYDELINVLKNRFMKPGESMTVRVTGIRTGHRGAVFNRLITLQREHDTAPAANEMSGQLGQVLNVMQEAQQKQAELMERILTPREQANPNKRDGVDLFLAIAGALTPIATAAFTALAARPKPQNDLKQMIEGVLALKGLSDSFSGGNSEADDSWQSLVKAVGPSALQALTAIAQTRPPAPQVMLPPPPPVPNPAPRIVPPQNAQPINPPDKETQEMLMMLKTQISELVTLAESGQTPEDAAKLAASLIPENYDAQLLPILEDKTRFAAALKMEPKTAAHAEWFEKFRVALLGEYEETPPA